MSHSFFVIGSSARPTEIFLVVDQNILCEVDVTDCILSLISVFFVFNICYTKGLNNVFTFLELALLNLPNKGPPSVINFFSSLKTILG